MGRGSTSADEHGFIRRWTVRLFKTGLVVGLLGLMVVAIFVATVRGEIDSFEKLKSSPNGQMIRVRALDGTVIQSMGPSFGRWIKIGDMPQSMKDAMVAVEDRRFYYHPGVDPIGITRSAWIRLRNGHFTQGGSTITQQLARNVYLNNNKEFGRKIREIILALAIETKFSKDEILELYLNKVYFGGGAFGVDAASRKFFDHGAEKLTLAESAIIAGLVKAPSRYSPTADAKAALGRAGVVVSVMQDAGMITAEQAANVKPAQVRMAAEPPQDSARYFTDWALPQLDGLIKERKKAIDVWTTLDIHLQKTATDVLRAQAPGGAQGAIVSMERDGAVRVLVGGIDYAKSNYNRAITAERQPGSSWKIFVYLAALEAGFRPDDKVVDQPIEIDGWQPKNSGGHYAGEMTLRTAFAYSKNTVAAYLGQEVGTSEIANMARRFGITTHINTGPSMVLGTSVVHVIDMTRAFASVSNNGRDVKPYGIVKVTTIDGDEIYHAKPGKSTQLVEDWVAKSMTDLMQTAVQTGTGKAAQIGRPVAGKTGTTTSNKDGWFLGFSSGLTTGVWMGRNDARPVKGLEGGRAPAQAWSSFMRVAVAKRPIEHFATKIVFPARLEEEEATDPESASGKDGEVTVDENGMPIEGNHPQDPAIPPDQISQEKLDEEWIDKTLGRSKKKESVADEETGANAGEGDPLN
jgi:penicillin-binding protein 1A